MKRIVINSACALFTIILLSGCLALSVGGGSKTEAKKPTLGEQLVDLQKARSAGAITEEQYQTQKAKLLGQ